ncbi:unnamed protein product [Trichobilharzia szidati]|nr:unnamed protein product [Trichobilharzia szidati]
MPNLPFSQLLVWLTVLTIFLRKVNCQCNLTSEESKLDLNQYDPKTVLPSRGNGSSCAVMTRLALGGAWLTNLDEGDVLCPPQLPEVCYFIALNTSLTRNEAHKFCSQLGLTLWRPWSLKEEIIMKSIMNSLNVSELIINVKVIDRYTIMDMDGNHITHE